MVKVSALNLSKFNDMLASLEGILRHRQAHPTSHSEELYYEMLVAYYQRIRQAQESGEFIVAHNILMPVEVFYAMDLVPMLLEGTSQSVIISQRGYEEVFSRAKSFGLPPEVCSTHRCIAGAFLEGWLPHPNVLVWNNLGCDNNVKSSEALLEFYDVPGFYMDRPYRFTGREADYLASEIGELVHFLEENSGRKLDWRRLGQALELSRRAVELHREIYELRRAIPHPMANRRTMQVHNINWILAGTPQAVAFLETVRDEVRAFAQEGKGASPHGEKYRILSLFLPPFYAWRLLDWMEREHGASVVADPYCSGWGEFQWDPNQPFLTLARKNLASPTARQMHGPIEAVVEDSVAAALSHKAEGAIFWAHIGCRQGCASLRVVKDALAQQVGIPTLIVDNDQMDPTFVSEAEMKEKIEAFMELLDERRSNAHR